MVEAILTSFKKLLLRCLDYFLKYNFLKIFSKKCFDSGIRDVVLRWRWDDATPNGGI